MRRTAMKILLTIGVFIIGGLIIAAMGEGTGTKHGGGIGVVFSMAALAAITAIWKWKPDANNSDNNKLDKR